MSRPAILLTLLLAGAGSAQAQVPRFSEVVQALDSQAPSRPTPVGDRAPLRIQASYQLQEASDRTATLDAQKESIQTAHARLYRIIGQECEVISQAFGGECRVVSLTVGNGGQSYGQVPLTTYTASAVFEVAGAPVKPK